MQLLPAQSRASTAGVQHSKQLRAAPAKRTSVCRRAVEIAEMTTKVVKSATVSDIYVGKGRYIKDDPKKYPSKEDAGFFVGAVGGWAGGEAALWKLREELEQAKANKATAKKATPSKPPTSAPAGKDVIYIGIDKEEMIKTGIKGRFIIDDPRKYPAKEDLGFLVGAAGGFAGGEAGLKQFVETGQLNLRPEGLPNDPQSSPIAKAGLIIAAGAGGGLLLNSLFDAGEEVVKVDIVQAPIDDNTKTMLLAALALLAAAGTIAGGRALLVSLQQRLQESAKGVVVVGAFWVVIFLIARAVLEA